MALGPYQTISMTKNEIIDALSSAISRMNGDDLEDSLVAAYQFGLFPELVPILVGLLPARWHTRHEDVARALQDLKDPRAVSALELAAIEGRFYDEEDEFLEFSRKCVWALADIGTLEAKSSLLRITACNNERVATFARRRIENWDAESYRKGA